VQGKHPVFEEIWHMANRWQKPMISSSTMNYAKGNNGILGALERTKQAMYT